MLTTSTSKRTAVPLGLTVVLGAILLANQALAQEQDLPWKRLGLNAGVFLPAVNSSARIDSDLGTGTQLDLEDDLNVDESVTSFRIDGFWRFLPRHRVDASYYTLSRDGSRAISRTLQIGDQTFTLGTTLVSEFDVDVYKLAYSYSLFQNETFDVAASIGAFVADISLSFSAAGVGAVSESLTAPLPVVGGRGAYAITDRLFARAQGQIFHIDTGDFSGTLFDVFLGLDYDVTDNLGIGVGYNFLDIDAEGDHTRADYSFNALMIYVRLFR